MLRIEEARGYKNIIALIFICAVHMGVYICVCVGQNYSAMYDVYWHDACLCFLLAFHCLLLWPLYFHSPLELERHRNERLQSVIFVPSQVGYTLHRMRSNFVYRPFHTTYSFRMLYSFCIWASFWYFCFICTANSWNFTTCNLETWYAV